ncbi:hypothetical protein PsYK624_069880 [Phanerochaete sordida]|uniref:Uncharacterized protein n=1 Tax=Phanerochaete sordida TaxID=48140 RepID=A0A9P3GBJ9_9APHY|nr:hypothetical protein PsYK624_069880 [Phanerochaete sordida]
MNIPLQTPFENLSTMAVVFCTLSALFGVYFVLVAIAVWATYRRVGKAWNRLRAITVVLFLVLCAHYSARALTFARARIENPPADEEAAWTVPLVFLGALTSTLAACISDGLLAWRFYVIYGRTKLAMYLPALMVTITALLGLSGDFQQFTIYKSVDLYNNRFAMLTYDVNAAWGWCTFSVNTILTASIIGRIVWLARGANAHHAGGTGHRQYNVIVEAIVESALVTWFGLLFYEIASFAPTGHITTAFNIGYVMVCITPVYFGISQCLITARLALTTLDDTVSHGAPQFSSCYSTRGAVHAGARTRGSAMPGMTFKVPELEKSQLDSSDDSTLDASLKTASSSEEHGKAPGCAV